MILRHPNPTALRLAIRRSIPRSSSSRSLSTLTRRPLAPIPNRSHLSIQPRTSSYASPIQTRHLSTEVRTAIDKAVASAPVVLFMKGTPETPQCGFSRASIQILGLQGVDPAKFSAFNVLEDAGLRSGIKEYSDWPTIPQLYVDKEFVGGCDILMSMHQNGELAKLLEDKGVLVPAESEEGAEKKGDGAA